MIIRIIWNTAKLNKLGMEKSSFIVAMEGPTMEPIWPPVIINGYPFFADDEEVEEATNDQNKATQMLPKLSIPT